MSREEDIQELCRQVIQITLKWNSDDNEYECPFCWGTGQDNDMDKLAHSNSCAYFIANDLSTELIKKD